MAADTQLSDKSVAELVQRMSKQTSTLVRQEMQLAQLELQQKGKRAGLGAGMFGASGVVALYGGGALVAGAVMALAAGVEPWLAGVIVGVALLLVAGVLALAGRKQVQAATPPAPERTIESVKQDVDEVKEAARR